MANYIWQLLFCKNIKSYSLAKKIFKGSLLFAYSNHLHNELFLPLKLGISMCTICVIVSFTNDMIVVEVGFWQRLLKHFIHTLGGEGGVYLVSVHYVFKLMDIW